MKTPAEAIVAISPGNSYFTEPVIERVIGDAAARYPHVTVLVPDVPAIDTYLALGHDFNRAREKAVTKGGNLIKSRVRRAMQRLALEENKVRILDWDKDIAPTPQYKEAYAHTERFYNTNTSAVFRDAVNDATQLVLKASGKVIPDMNAATAQGAKCLLAELAFLDAAVPLLSVPRADVICHKRWHVYESLIGGAFDGVKRPYLGFALSPAPGNP